MKDGVHLVLTDIFVEDEMPTKSQSLRKDRILSELTGTRHKVLSAASKIFDKDQDIIFLGIWSIRDLIAHLIGWDYTNLNAIKSVMQKQIPDFYKYHDHDWQAYNAILVRKHKKGPIQNLLARANDSHETLVRFLQTIPRLLESETNDERIHYQQITGFFEELT